MKIAGNEYTVESIAAYPVQVTEDDSAYLLHVGGLQNGDWVYEVTIDATSDDITQHDTAQRENVQHGAVLQDGIYEAQIVTESISPVSFIFN